MKFQIKNDRDAYFNEAQINFEWVDLSSDDRKVYFENSFSKFRKARKADLLDK